MLYKSFSSMKERGSGRKIKCSICKNIAPWQLSIILEDGDYLRCPESKIAFKTASASIKHFTRDIAKNRFIMNINSILWSEWRYQWAMPLRAAIEKPGSIILIRQQLSSNDVGINNSWDFNLILLRSQKPISIQY